MYFGRYLSRIALRQLHRPLADNKNFKGLFISMSEKLFKGWNRSRITILLVGVTILIAGIASGYWYMTTRNINPIPQQIRSQLTFSPFVLPSNTNNYSATDYKFSTAEDKVQILSYLIHSKNSTISVSEYPQPLEFTEIPEYKDRFLTNIINQYATVTTANGVIYLGRAVKQNNKQLAIMIERGLLVFMSPDKDLEQTEWRNLGDQLEIQKNN